MKRNLLIIAFLLMILPVFGGFGSDTVNEPELTFKINEQRFTLHIMRSRAGTDILLRGIEDRNISRNFPGENLFPGFKVRDNRVIVTWNRYREKQIDLCYYDSRDQKSHLIQAPGFHFISRPEPIFRNEELVAMVFKGNNSDNDDLFAFRFDSREFINLTRTPDNEKVFEISQEGETLRIETRTLYHKSVIGMNLENNRVSLLEKEPLFRDPQRAPWEWNSVTLNTIIAYGDSITVGEMRMNDLEGELHPELAYLAKVQELLEEYGETYIINLGKSATNTFHAVERMDEVFSVSPAYFCLILYGTNDVGWNLFSAASSAENLEWVCLNARNKYGMYPIISTVPPAKLWEPGVQVFKEETEALNARIIELANRNNIPYINTYQAFFNHPDGWEACLEDIKGNHPSPLGHEIMAGLFAPKILDVPPAQPRNISQVANTPNYIMVQWSDNVEFDFDFCRIEYGFEPNTMNRTARSSGNYIKFLNLPFDPYLNQKIYFRIQAVDMDGNTSAFTQVISIEFDR